MSSKITCVRCEELRPPSRSDPDFCQECFERVRSMVENPMPHVEALAGLSRAGASEKTKMYGFLSIFHPKLSHKRKLEICSDLK